ncbi:MAG: DUF1415 domain-containing protein [Chromatiales bacterium]|jgi:hypothetical protein
MTDVAEQRTRCWLERWVIGQNLCPFAGHPYREGRVRLACSEADDSDALFRFVLDEIDLLLDKSADEIETSVLIVENSLVNFDDYLDFLELLQRVVDETNLTGVLQIASFHPDYCFEDVQADDVSNYTNRSPYPLFHLIREQSLEQALAHYPNPEQIPQRNIELLRDMGVHKVREYLANCD